MITTKLAIVALLLQAGNCTFLNDSNAADQLRPEKAFDAISIRQVQASDRTEVGGTVSYQSAAHKLCVYSQEKVICQLSLQELLEEAYQRKRYEIAGPIWLKENVFLVQAILPEKTGGDDARLMLQKALEDRFEVRTHIERKPVPVFELVPGKNGTHLVPADAQKLPRPALNTRRGGTLVITADHFAATATTLDALAVNAGNFAGLDRPLVNGTGLQGEYKVDLHWIPTEDPELQGKFRDPGILDAIRSQLGLVVQKREPLSDVLVIDHALRTPNENP